MLLAVLGRIPDVNYPLVTGPLWDRAEDSLIERARRLAESQSPPGTVILGEAGVAGGVTQNPFFLSMRRALIAATSTTLSDVVDEGPWPTRNPRSLFALVVDAPRWGVSQVHAVAVWREGVVLSASVRDRRAAQSRRLHITHPAARADHLAQVLWRQLGQLTFGQAAPYGLAC